MIDVQDMICYYRALEDRNFSSKACEFLKKNTTILNVTNHSLVVELRKLDELNMENKIIIIDNTGFPDNGALADDDVKITSKFYFEIHPSNTFYHWTLGCKIIKSFIIILFFENSLSLNR